MKIFTKKIIRSLGWDLHRFSPSSNSTAQLLAAFNHVQIDLVFDIGANVGQFAQELRTAGFSGKIISFEPLSVAHQSLTKAAGLDNGWFAHSRAALGDHDGEVEINIAGNSVSSSVLTMLHSHSSAAPGSAFVTSERTPLIRLDTVAQSYLEPNSRPFLKLDTQGFEWQVLDGASETLKLAKGLLLELSLVPLYEGQKLWQELILRLEEEGFVLWAIQKGFTDPRTGRSLQVDAIFLRQ